MSEKFQWFNDIKFTRDDHTGYYLNSTIRKRMHIYVWEYYNGKIPKGYEVHHKDFDRSNNDISNLQLLTRSEHRKLHSESLTQEQRDWKRNNLNVNARPKAIEWHKSEEGRKWHSEQAKVTLAKTHQQVEMVCVNCGKSYIGEHKSKFCSNNCKSAYRRKSGVDNITEICAICGLEFQTNKYRKSQTCSRHCAMIYKWRIQNESKKSNQDG